MTEENKPNPEPQNPEDTESQATAKPAAAQEAKAKKEKKPAVEDKPFAEFIQQDFTPALKQAFAKEGIEDIELTLTNKELPLSGANPDEKCWQVIGNWQNGQRQFNLYFLNEDINGKKAFSYAANAASPSTIESFMIDERKVDLGLLVMYTMQRLNGQKWLTRN